MTINRVVDAIGNDIYAETQNGSASSTIIHLIPFMDPSNPITGDAFQHQEVSPYSKFTQERFLNEAKLFLPQIEQQYLIPTYGDDYKQNLYDFYAAISTPERAQYFMTYLWGENWDG